MECPVAFTWQVFSDGLWSSWIEIGPCSWLLLRSLRSPAKLTKQVPECWEVETRKPASANWALQITAPWGIFFSFFFWFVWNEQLLGSACAKLRTARQSLCPFLYCICVLIYSREMHPEEWFNNKRWPVWGGEEISVLSRREGNRQSSGKGVASLFISNQDVGEQS